MGYTEGLFGLGFAFWFLHYYLYFSPIISIFLIIISYLSLYLSNHYPQFSIIALYFFPQSLPKNPNQTRSGNEPRTFVLNLHLHCENGGKEVKEVVGRIKGVRSVDIIDQEQGKVRISGNVEPQTVIEKLPKRMRKRAELGVEGGAEESPPKIKNQIVHKPLLRDRKPVEEPMAIRGPDCCPTHNHELELKSYNKPFTCNRCMENGFTSGYRCKLCVYDIHKECMNPKRKITHKLCDIHEECIFKFHQTVPPTWRRICDACGMKINGYSYRCKAHGLDLHPRCSNLPRKLHIGDTEFVLMCKNVKQRCFSCKKKVHSQLVEKDVPGWCYVSKRDKFYCHVNCVSQMVHEAWKRGDLAPNDDYEKNDGTSKALEKVNLKLVAKSNGSGRGGGNLFLKTVTVFLKVVVGILFGDPTGLIVFAVTELVQ